MQNRTHKNHPQKKKNGVTFFCDTCKIVGKVLVECWTDKSDGPYKINLVQHENLMAMEVGQISINKKPKGDTIRFHFCGHCGHLLGNPMDTDYINVIDHFDHIKPNDQN